ncbi:MAG: haloacid dehalogenase, partial [Atopobiaceae bacterium]|nr:haloacid dehalogenase [Atopobiaceae bacterium]
MSVEEEGMSLAGLTSAQVADRVERGLTNANTDVKTKSVRQILAEHTFTLFNGVNFGLAIVVFFTGQYRNAAFMGVVLLNLFIGVFQEVRAKQMVDRLTILTAKLVKVLRDGQEMEISVEEIVVDDVVLLAHGDQIPADGVVLRGDPLV